MYRIVMFREELFMGESIRIPAFALELFQVGLRNDNSTSVCLVVSGMFVFQL